MNDRNKITIYLDANGDREAAEQLSRRLGVPIADSMGEELTLVFDGTGLSLVGYGMRYQGDFSRMLNRVTKGRLRHEMLVKIAKTKTEHPTAVDAAAGMGEDSFLLAAFASIYDVKRFHGGQSTIFRPFAIVGKTVFCQTAFGKRRFYGDFPHISSFRRCRMRPRRRFWRPPPGVKTPVRAHCAVRNIMI